MGLISALLCFTYSGCAGCDDEDLTQLHPLIATSVDRVVFAEVFVGASSEASVQLSNPGTRATVVRDIVVSGAPFVAVTPPPTSLEPGASVQLGLRFTPPSSGPHEGTLTVTSDAENEPTLTITLSGVGLEPEDCDDDNECTDERFDAVAGVCVRAFAVRGCDDDNACTQGDRCDEGACVGFAVSCDDDVACTVDACDADVGCVFIPDAGRCDDDDPCTLDTCASNGCQNGPAPDGTPCGRIVQCDVVDLCLSQLCVPFDIPDGSPCNDANICTRGDVCDDGTCAGVGVPQVPEVVGESHRLLLTWDAAISDDRLFLMGDRMLTVPLNEDVPFAPAGAVSGVGMERRLGVDKPALAQRGDALIAVSPLPTRGPADGAHHLFFLSADGAAIVEEVNLGRPVLRHSSGFAYGEDVVAICDDGDDDDVFDVVFVDTAPPHAQRTVTGFDGSLFCLTATGHGSDGVLGLEIRGGDIVTLDVDDDLAVLGSAAVEVPLAYWSWRVRGDRGFISDDEGQQHVLLDLADPAAPRAVPFSLDRPALLDDLVGTTIIAHDSDGFFLIDIADIDTPTFIDWRLPIALSDLRFASVGAANEEHVFIIAALPVRLFRGALDQRGVITPDPLQGFGGMARIVGDGDRLLGVSRTDLVIIDASSVEGALRPDAPASKVSIPGPSLVGRTSAAPVLYAPPLEDRSGFESGPITSNRSDLRQALENSTDPVVASAIFTIDDAGDVSTDFGLPLGELEEASVLFAPASGAQCNGAALVQRRDGDADGDCVLGVGRDPDCEEGVAPRRIWVVSFSVCGGGVTPVGLAPIEDDSIDVLALSEARSVAHGATMTFFVKDRAFLVDIDSLPEPRVMAAAPDARFDGATALSAGFDQNVWVIATTQVDAAPIAAFYDVDVGDAVAELRDTLTLGGVAPAGVAIRARVLGVSAPRAWLSTWDEGEAFVRGHGVVGVDLFSSPLRVVDTLPLASEATNLIASEDALIIGRVDGISVVSPPCSQP